jgi:T-complex protein 1 subunit delta
MSCQKEVILFFLLCKRSIVAGGSAVEVELYQKLGQYSRELSGVIAYVVKAYAEALEVIPYTLAENAGLIPINIVTQLKNKHADGFENYGIDIKKVRN